MNNLFDSLFFYSHKIYSKLKHYYIVRLGPFIRTIKAPPFPNNPDGKVLVHIGCGELNDERFINVDARAMPHIHYVTENLELTQFSHNSIDLIYACHVLEHVSSKKLLTVLYNWFNCLKPGGALRLSVPDFDRIIEIYADQGKDIEVIQLPLMGGQEYEFNYHLSVFNSEYLYKLLQKCGFREIREWDPLSVSYHSFNDWSKIPFIVNGEQYKISLNIEAIR